MIIESIIVHSLVVFAITLIITKSRIMACKRFFVEERYQFVLDSGEIPCLLHEWWHAMFVCEMCCGFWVALATAPYLSECGIVVGTLAAFSGNWLLHCLEDYLYVKKERVE